MTRDQKKAKEVIVIAGAPGTGKSSVVKLLQKKLQSPCFEFGWIPEFRNKNGKEISYSEEEALAFENLHLVVKNYIKHGFRNIILSDFEDKRIVELHKSYADTDYILFTLFVSDDELLKGRVLDDTRSSDYRDYKEAIKINRRIMSRELLPHETKIDSTSASLEEVMGEILSHINR